MTLNMAAFLPTFIESDAMKWKGGIKPSTYDVTLIISIFYVVQIIFAPFTTCIKNKLGTKNTIVYGFVLLTSTTFGLGLLAEIPDANKFYKIALALRVLQGFGDIIVQVTFYTVICEVFSDSLTAAITKIEVVNGFGQAMGPFIGSIVYDRLQYEKTLFLFGGLNALAMIVSIIFIPSILNANYIE